MTKKRYTESEIKTILLEQSAGMTPQEICDKHCISVATFYNWRARYRLSDVYESCGSLGQENNRLKQLLADSLLEIDLLKKQLARKEC